MEAHDHVTAEILLEYLEKRLDEGSAARVHAHLETRCVRCVAELAFWTRLLAALRRSQATAPPEEVVEQAIAIFDRSTDNRAVRRPPWPERIAPRMGPPALVGARGSLQLFFRAVETDIDLLCECREGGWHITGQALSSDASEAGWTVTVTGDVGSAVTKTDARGEFYVPRLAPGLYHLMLWGSHRRIILPGVRLEGALS